MQEHLFVTKITIDLYNKFDKVIILSTWNVSKFFDAECLVDVMNELHKNDIRVKLYRLIYLMNRNTRIQVSTPVGASAERGVGETLGQGTIEGAIASAVNLDNGVTDFFHESLDEVYYVSVKLAPLLFQDDVARLSLSVQSAQSGNDRMRCVAETKLLDFNLENSGYAVFGAKRRRQELQNELNEQPLQLCGRDMKHL